MDFCRVNGGGIDHLFIRFYIGRHCACGRTILVADARGRTNLKDVNSTAPARARAAPRTGAGSASERPRSSGLLGERAR